MKKPMLSILIIVSTVVFLQAQSGTALTSGQAMAMTGKKVPVKHTTTRRTYDPDAISRLPQFPGGTAALYAFMVSEVQYPEQAVENGREGIVKVRVTVAADGSLSNFTIVSKANPILDDAAMKVVQAMPDWEPALQQGRSIKCKITIPVTYTLQ